MKVIKFGGTSVGSANSILSVKRIVEAVEEPVIVVVSALGGITDKLINTSKMAAAGDAAYENIFQFIEQFTDLALQFHLPLTSRNHFFKVFFYIA